MHKKFGVKNEVTLSSLETGLGDLSSILGDVVTFYFPTHINRKSMNPSVLLSAMDIY